MDGLFCYSGSALGRKPCAGSERSTAPKAMGEALDFKRLWVSWGLRLTLPDLGEISADAAAQNGIRTARAEMQAAPGQTDRCCATNADVRPFHGDTGQY